MRRQDGNARNCAADIPSMTLLYAPLHPSSATPTWRTTLPTAVAVSCANKPSGPSGDYAPSQFTTTNLLSVEDAVVEAQLSVAPHCTPQKCLFVRQIRNLEIRLAKYTNSDRQHQAACAQWRERHHGAGCDGDTLDSFPWREPLSAVEEEPPSQYAANNSWHSPTTTVTGSDSAACVESVLHEPVTSPARAKSTNGASALRAWGARLRKIEGTFRQSYTVLGARAAQAGEGAAAVAAAARKAAQEAAQSSAVAGGQNKGEGGRWRANTRSQAKLDGIAFDEYWGSDYCTSV